jgi:hypothetical protein
MGLLIAAIILPGSVSIIAQAVPPTPKPGHQPFPTPAPRTRVQPRLPRPPAVVGEVSERSIKVDPGVNVWLPCVSRGTIKVTGWDRNEVRVFIDGGNKFIFVVQEKSPSTGEPVWIKVSGIQDTARSGTASECIWGGDVEVDVPLNASVNIKGNEISARIDSVRKAEVKVVGGNLSLRNIANGIGAYAGQGDISVEASKGSISLESTTGNILVFEAGPSEIGDMFRAKTNGGAISLQGLGHRQLDVSSISGSVNFSGDIRSGGTYNLRTLRGSIRMSIPERSSSKISATYGYGSFRSEIPIEILTENISEGPVKSIVGTLGGGGDSAIRLTSNNGSISITKKQP